MTCRNWWWWWW